MQLSRLEHSLLIGRRGPFLKPDGEQGGGGGNGSEGKNDANPGGNEGEPKDTKKDGEGQEGKVEFSDEQQRHIGKLLSAERKKAADQARNDAKAEADAAAETARKEKEAADLKAKGDFETVETQLKTDLDAAKTEATALKAEADQLKAAIDDVLKADWDALGDDVREYYPGAEDDTLAKVSWLPKGKALQAKLHPEAKSAARGNGRDPKPGGDGKTNNEAASKAQAGLYRNF